MRFWPWMNLGKHEPANHEAASLEYARYDAYSRLLDRNGRWIEVADIKAGAVLVFLTAIFPILSGPALEIIPGLLGRLPVHATAADISPVVGLIVLIVTFAALSLYSLIQVFAVFNSRVTRETAERKSGSIFFGDVANQEFEVWCKQMFTRTAEELAEEVLEQIYSTARIAMIKHRYAQKALRGVFAAVIVGLIVLVTSRLLG